MRLSRPLGVAAIAVVLAGCTSATHGSGGTSATVPPAAPGSTSPAASGTSTTTAQPGAGFDDPTKVAAILAGARRGFAKVNSYDYRHLARDRAAGLAVTTGSFAAQYRKAFDDTVTPQARKLRAVQRGAAVDVGIASVGASGDASVLVFGTLHFASRQAKTRAEPVSVLLTLHPVGGHWLVAGVLVHPTSTAAPPGNRDLVLASVAARAEIVALLSLTRSRYDADYARALALTTGTMHSDLVAKKSTTRQALQQGGFDLAAAARAVAASSASGARAVFLISVDGYQVKNGKKSAPSPQRLLATATEVRGRWLVSDLQTIGVS